MSLVIYHNPRCSKSRKTLEIIQQAGVTPRIVEYLSETPSAARIVHLAGLNSELVAKLLRDEAPTTATVVGNVLDDVGELQSQSKARSQWFEPGIMVRGNGDSN